MPPPPKTSRIPKLNESWCGCSLKTATKIIAYFETITNAVLFTLVMTQIYFIMKGWATEEFPKYFIEGVPVLIFMSMEYLFMGLISVYLLIGVHKAKPNYIKTWIVMKGIYIITCGISSLIYAIILTMGHPHGILITEIIGLGIQMYFFLLVYSYYRDLKAGAISLENIKSSDKVEICNHNNFHL